MTTRTTRRSGLMVAVLAVTLLGAGCYAQDMANQDRYDPLEASELFDNGMASREPIEGTVARGQLFEDDHLYRGIVDGQPAADFPFEITADVMARGQERYQIFCTPCHDQLGTGNGIVVQRGFRRPSSFHTDRLREAAPGYYFDVMTNGFGAMYSYSAQVSPEDRWAIAAYIRALQLSQNATEAELAAEDLELLGVQQ